MMSNVPEAFAAQAILVPSGEKLGDMSAVLFGSLTRVASAPGSAACM